MCLFGKDFCWDSPTAVADVECIGDRIKFTAVCGTVPSGKFCRRSTLMFSCVPRCHGLYGSKTKTRIPVDAVSSTPVPFPDPLSRICVGARLMV